MHSMQIIIILFLLAKREHSSHVRTFEYEITWFKLELATDKLVETLDEQFGINKEIILLTWKVSRLHFLQFFSYSEINSLAE